MSAPKSTPTAFEEGATMNANLQAADSKAQQLGIRSGRLAWLAYVLHDPAVSALRGFDFGRDEAPFSLEQARRDLSRETLLSEYGRLFGHTPGGSCPLYELSWLRPGDFALEQELGDIAGFYRAFGLALDPRAHERLDHISVEIEFLSYLTHLESEAICSHWSEQAEVARQAARTFFRDHLGRWAPPLFERMESRAAAGFYCWVAQFGRELFQRLAEELDVRPEIPAGEAAPLRKQGPNERGTGTLLPVHPGRRPS